ncbi:hypothetical protein G3578_09795 [Brevibacillus sp. SYP-B805]|uniref:YopX family protein n=1 Tax=Brevibacillus sp. SYP-B805 TaxID=1578199 RepID=UPI0013EB2A87|nr:YopX family protein [Brevibacillus sp. SYP-B805]NGQ95445.1 hypothetical protein [Brevibacillus sp. SYP-B805]
MREIKFRAWDEEKKRMFDGDAIEEHDLITGLSYGKLFVATEDPDWREMTVMQFTGLHDKNGREIYEGDLVRNHRRVSVYGDEILKVIYQEAVITESPDGVRWTSEKPGFRFIRIGKGMITAFVPHEDLEVIGNIYENPELLQSEKRV